MFGSRKSSLKKLEKEQLHGSPLVSFYEPKSVLSEEFRTIRTNLEFALVDKELKTVAISSSVPMEGKSTISANLAYIIGQTNKNVLIVDTDLRKPTVHKTFKLSNEQGLTTLIADPSKPFNKVIQRSRELNLYFLPSGPIPPNPAELLGSARMYSIMQELLKNFDMIIYDTPPINTVTDAQIVATRVDGVLLVVRQNFTRMDQISEAKKSLDKVNANILGFILNDVPEAEGRNSGYYAYYGSEE